MKQDTDITRGRAELKAALERYEQRYPSEQPIVRRMVAFLEREHACFERSTLEGHYTGSAWIVHPTDGRVLLTHHRKLNKWLQLGGHADGLVNLLEVAMNEAIEESGIREFEVIDAEIFDIDIHVIPARAADPEHLHYDVRYLLRAATHEYVVSDESHDLAWIDIGLLDTLTTEESMIRMAHKWNDINRQLSSMLP